ncbi:MAG TPA: aspartate-alanine antiporter [Terriglobales bacterium]|jgi:putative transport protein|nr:aspartate-alanine antiporter [Terriglobales bacterium]
MDYLIKALQQNPELAIFLALAIGFAIGRVKIGGFSLGTVVGTLFAGVIIGQLDIKVPALVKTVFFDLFLFTTGYKVGPQFFRGLKRDALSQMALTLVLCVTCLITAVVAAKLLGYDIGTAAGLLAGAFTESTVIGTAGDAINRLAISAEEKAQLLNNIPVAYAVTYLVGTTAVVWFLPTIGPKLMGVNLKDEAKKMQAQVSGGAEAQPGIMSPSRSFDVRAYRVTNEKLFNKTIAEIEAMPQEFRVFIQRLRREGTIIEPEPNTVIHQGDVIAVMAKAEFLVERVSVVGPEVDDKELLDFPVEFLDVVVTNKALVGKPLADLSKSEPWRTQFRGVFLRKVMRAATEIPITLTTQVERGDLLSVVGAKRDVDRAVTVLGYADWPSSATDMVFVGTGIVLGGLVGLLSVNIAGLPITLTASGGALIMGLVFGWLRSVFPVFGRIPEAAMWVFDTVGLSIFIGVVGLSAGPSFIAGLQKSGISLVFVGLVAAVLPHFVAICFGRYVLKMNPVILLGACSGAGTMTAALRAIQDEAQSKLPALGYTVPYAVGNIVLTAWGPVIVALLSLGK